MGLASIVGFAKGPIVGGVQIDCAVSETHSKTAVVSTSPVDEGKDISDHIRPKNWALEMHGMLSDFPTTLRAKLNRKEASERFDQLVALLESAETFEINTAFKFYQNMAMTNLSVTKDRTTGETIAFQASFQEIVIAYSDTVKALEADKHVESKKNAGTKKPEAASEAAEESARTSAAYDFFNWASGGAIK